jgi:hypothetical protein
MTDLDDLTRRIADCLEQHLHEHGWQPYRYPSGEHKGVEVEPKQGVIWLIGPDGLSATLRVEKP